MKYVKLFEDYLNSLNEGKGRGNQILVFPEGDPHNYEGSMEYTHAHDHIQNWLNKGGTWVVIVNFLSSKERTNFERGEYDEFTVDPRFRSIPNGTWDDTTLPKFTDVYPKYNEVEFDVLGIKPNKLNPATPWIHLADKKGLEFCVTANRLLDAQRGDSLKDNIQQGSTYLIDSKRAKISGYRNGIVEVTFEKSKTIKKFPLKEWKEKHFMSLDEL